MDKDPRFCLWDFKYYIIRFILHSIYSFFQFKFFVMFVYFVCNIDLSPEHFCFVSLIPELFSIPYLLISYFHNYFFFFLSFFLACLLCLFLDFILFYFSVTFLIRLSCRFIFWHSRKMYLTDFYSFNWCCFLWFTFIICDSFRVSKFCLLSSLFSFFLYSLD